MPIMKVDLDAVCERLNISTAAFVNKLGQDTERFTLSGSQDGDAVDRSSAMGCALSGRDALEGEQERFERFERVGKTIRSGCCWLQVWFMGQLGNGEMSRLNETRQISRRGKHTRCQGVALSNKFSLLEAPLTFSLCLPDAVITDLESAPAPDCPRSYSLNSVKRIWIWAL